MQISCIRLSDKTSRLRPRHVVPKPGQTYEPEVPVEVREWIAPAPPDFVLEARRLRLLPAGAFAGRDLHPLESAAFSRRTQIAAIAEGRAEWVKPIRSGSSQWPSSDRKGRKSCRCARRCLYPDRSSQRHVRHRLDPESLGIVGRSMANRLA